MGRRMSVQGLNGEIGFDNTWHGEEFYLYLHDRPNWYNFPTIYIYI